jgi:hypothetical protein
MAWELLGNVNGDGTSSTLDSGTIDEKDYLHIVAFGVDATPANFQFQFNGNAGTVYSIRRSYDGGGDATYASQTKIISYSATSSSTSYLVLDVYNATTAEKLIIGQTIDIGTAGAGTVPNRAEYVAKFSDTSNGITSVQLNTNGSNFESEAYLQVFGTD